MLAVLLAPPNVAVTVYVPGVEPSAARPVPSIELPVPVIDQLNVGELIALPNWSVAVAENCCDPPGATVTDDGVTITPVGVCCTVTATALVTNNPPESVIVTVKL